MDTMHIDQVHFIGVGGVGMSGIARVAFDQGMRVSGTDLKESRYTKQLREAGIEVHIGHDPANIPEGNPVIVVSTAILDNNPELAAAKARGVEFGRPHKSLPNHFDELLCQWQRKELTAAEIAKLCGVSRSTIYRRRKQTGES